MTDYQDALVLENLDLVNWVIRTPAGTFTMPSWITAAQ